MKGHNFDSARLGSTFWNLILTPYHLYPLQLSSSLIHPGREQCCKQHMLWSADNIVIEVLILMLTLHAKMVATFTEDNIINSYDVALASTVAPTLTVANTSTVHCAGDEAYFLIM